MVSGKVIALSCLAIVSSGWRINEENMIDDQNDAVLTSSVSTRSTQVGVTCNGLTYSYNEGKELGRGKFGRVHKIEKVTNDETGEEIKKHNMVIKVKVARGGSRIKEATLEEQCVAMNALIASEMKVPTCYAAGARQCSGEDVLIMQYLPNLKETFKTMKDRISELGEDVDQNRNAMKAIARSALNGFFTMLGHCLTDGDRSTSDNMVVQDGSTDVWFLDLGLVRMWGQSDGMIEIGKTNSRRQPTENFVHKHVHQMYQAIIGQLTPTPEAGEIAQDVVTEEFSGHLNALLEANWIPPCVKSLSAKIDDMARRDRLPLK